MHWLNGMNEAATRVNVSLQLCMMNPVHTLASTLLTKGKQTPHRTRVWHALTHKNSRWARHARTHSVGKYQSYMF